MKITVRRLHVESTGELGMYKIEGSLTVTNPGKEDDSLLSGSLRLSCPMAEGFSTTPNPVPITLNPVNIQARNTVDASLSGSCLSFGPDRPDASLSGVLEFRTLDGEAVQDIVTLAKAQTGWEYVRP